MIISERSAFDSLYKAAPSLLPSNSFFMTLFFKNPPRAKKGHIANVIKDILHEKKKARIIPIIIPRRPYSKIEIVSVESPLSSDISSETTFVRTPGALSLLSNQEISLKIIPANNFYLTV